jgi:gliding motility-associated-like protein
MNTLTRRFGFLFLLHAIIGIGFLSPYEGAAQVWVPVEHYSGTQVINGRNVTVTPAGSVRQEQTFARCGATPYTAGINYGGIPGSFTFSFSPVVTRVRFIISATNLGEINSFYINGAHYPLTPANLFPWPACDTQFQLPLDILGGNLIFPGPIVPGQSYFGQFGSGEVIIDVPTGINSIRMENNGIGGGSSFGFFYWGFYAEAGNNNPCQQDTLRLYGKPDVAGVGYLWTGPNGFTSTDKDPLIPNADLIHEGIYTLRTTIANDTAYDTTLVRVREVPATPSVSGDTLVCFGSTARMRASSPTPGVGYLWTGPNNYKSTNANANVRNTRYRDTGTYTVVSVLNGCPSPPATWRVQVIPPAEGDTVDVEICSGGTYDFYGKQLKEAGVYSQTFYGVTADGCDSVTSVRIIVRPPVSDTLFAAICSGGSYDFHGRVVTQEGWYTDSLRTAEGCDSLSVLRLTINPPVEATLSVFICSGEDYVFGERKISEPGVYRDTTKTASGCDSVTVLHLSFYEKQKVSAQYEHFRVPCIGDTVTVLASGAESYAWIQGGQRREGNPQKAAITDLETSVLLMGTDRNGCTDTATLTIGAEPCCKVFVPGAFTPNGDGRNDRFRILSPSGMAEYRIRIFNRWGQEVFASEDINSSWDGMFNGAPAEVGTYFYHVSGKCLTGAEVNERGDLTLIR